MVRNIYSGLLRFFGIIVLPMLLTACFGAQEPQPEGEMVVYTDDLLDLDSDLAIDKEVTSARDNPGSLVDNPASASTFCEGECLADRMEIGDVSVELSSVKDPGLDLLLSSEPGNSGAVPSKGRKARQASRGNGRLHAASVPDGVIPHPANEKAALCDGSKIVCISSPFGVNRPGHIHKGVDISAPLGSPIKAFRNGVVIDAKRHHSYGNVVDIQQNDGLISRYAHMSQILVKPGERIWQGQVIGRVGSTGRSSGPHLHFELIRGNKAMNPMLMLASPNHVVAAATASDAEHARRALRSSGDSSGRSRSAYRAHRQVVDRHAPARGKWKGKGRVSSAEGKKRVSSKGAGSAATSGKKAASAKSRQKDPAAAQKKVREKSVPKRGQKMLASNDRRPQERAVKGDKKSRTSKSEARSEKNGRASTSKASTSKAPSRKVEKKKAAPAARQAGKRKK